MSKQLTIKPASKPVQTYYEALKSYGAQGVEHKGGIGDRLSALSRGHGPAEKPGYSSRSSR